MSLSLSLEVQQTMRLALSLVGGATSSIFPRVEALLIADDKYRRAIEDIACRKNMNRYRSVMDFLVCEIFTSHRRSCFRYYKGKGPKLKDLISIEELFDIEVILVMALDFASELREMSDRPTWNQFRDRVLRAA